MTEPRFYTFECSGYLTIAKPDSRAEPGISVHVVDRFSWYIETFRSEDVRVGGTQSSNPSRYMKRKLARERAAARCAELNAWDEALCA